MFLAPRFQVVPLRRLGKLDAQIRGATERRRRCRVPGFRTRSTVCLLEIGKIALDPSNPGG
jgi:hypothetical protein